MIKELNVRDCKTICLTTNLWTYTANSSYLFLAANFIINILMKSYEATIEISTEWCSIASMVLPIVLGIQPLLEEFMIS
jgi:hypothetical protein